MRLGLRTMDVLWLLCLWVACLWGSDNGADAFHMPPALKKNMETLTDHYKVSKELLFRGGAVFPSGLTNDSFGDIEQKLLMGAALEVYLSMLKQMLNQMGQGDQVVRDSMVVVQKKLEQLHVNYFQGHTPELRRLLQKLWDIKTGEALVQGKALFELKKVYVAASDLAGRINKKSANRRRRRQAQGLRPAKM